MTAAEFKKVWLPLSDAFYRTAFYILENEADANDAVQDLYVKLWNSRRSLESVLKPQAYGVTLIKNICLDRLRHRKTAQADSLDGIDVSAGDSSPYADMVHKDSLRKLQALVEELPDKQRTVLKLRVYEEMDYDKIAEVTGLSETNLRVLLSTARKTLRNKFRI